MAKKAKVASRNSPSNRGKAVVFSYNGNPVVKVSLLKRTEGKLQKLNVAAYQKEAASSNSKLFVKDEHGDLVSWTKIVENI